MLIIIMFIFITSLMIATLGLCAYLWIIGLPKFIKERTPNPHLSFAVILSLPSLFIVTFIYAWFFGT